MNIKWFSFFLLVLALFMISCDSNGSGEDKNKVPVVYSVGDYRNSLDVNVACYWRNDVKIDLGNSTDYSTALDVFSIGSDIYVAGNHIPAGGNQTACYWLNGERVDLGDGVNSSMANSIFVTGSDVYVAGKYKPPSASVQVACYWKNGVRTDLATSIESSEGSYIKVENDIVYVGGSHGSGGSTVYCYWIDGVISNLSEYYDHNITSFDVDGEDLYMGGNYLTDISNPDIPCIWKNGTKITLASGVLSAKVESIDIQSNEVYAGGFVRDASNYINACIWNNGVRTDIANIARVYTIALNGEDFYAGGYTGTISDGQASYWLNGELIALGSGLTESRIFDMVVVLESI